jgi:hypothetical protein
MTYDVGNPDPGFGQAQKYGRVKCICDNNFSDYKHWSHRQIDGLVFITNFSSISAIS